MVNPTHHGKEFPPFRLDSDNECLWRHRDDETDERIRLTPKAFAVLRFLVEYAGRLLTEDELLAAVWPNVCVQPEAIKTQIHELRKLLGDDPKNPRFIETLPRCGYRFVGQLQGEKPENPAPAPDGHNIDVRNIRAIAVLPLKDLSEDAGHEYFSDSMTEALINSLARIKVLRVISRTSAMQYKGAGKSLPEIARELNVDAVIEGSVLRSGERVRITTRLIHAASDQHLWGETYDRDFLDILSLQSEISRQVANEVMIILSPEENARLASGRLVNRDAHESYLKARYYWNKRSDDGVKKAVAYFHRAIDSDRFNMATVSARNEVYPALAKLFHKEQST